jgi:hypothetical protein
MKVAVHCQDFLTCCVDGIYRPTIADPGLLQGSVQVCGVVNANTLRSLPAGLSARSLALWGRQHGSHGEEDRADSDGIVRDLKGNIPELVQLLLLQGTCQRTQANCF